MPFGVVFQKQNKKTGNKKEGADMFGHHTLHTPKETQKEHTKNSSPKGNFFCGDFTGNHIGEEGGKRYQNTTKKPNGQKAFPKHLYDHGKKEESDRWF